MMAFSPLILKQLKEVKFGDTVSIAEIQTAIVRYGVPKEVNDDPESWEAFSKICNCTSFFKTCKSK